MFNFSDRTLPLLMSLLLLPVPSPAVATPFSREVAQTPAATVQDIRQLEQGKPIERQMSGSEKHTYQVTVQAGQYLQVAVQQKGIDLVVTLFAPDGKQITQVDEYYAPDSESIQAVVETSGNYRIEIRPFESSAASGGYEVKIEELREATAQDRNRAAARQAFKEGEQLRSQGTQESLQQAIEKYKRAIPLFQAVGNKAREATILNNIGVVYWNLGEKQKALEYYNQALSLYHEVGNKSGEATILNNIGLVYDSLGEKQKALEYYNQALPLYRTVGNKSREATTLTNIIAVYDDLGEKQKVIEYYKQVLLLYRAIGDKDKEITILNDIGNIHKILGENLIAIEYYNQALLLSRAVVNKDGEATTLNEIGNLYNKLGEKQKALEYYNQALSLWRTLEQTGKVKSAQTAIIESIGKMYSNLAEFDKAIDFYNQQLSILQRSQDSEFQGEITDDIANIYDYIGDIYKEIGDYQNAIYYYHKILINSQKKSTNESRALGELSEVYSAMGDYQQALDYLNQILAIARQENNRFGVNVTIIDIGKVYSAMGDYQKALDFFNQALVFSQEIFKRYKDITEISYLLRAIGNTYFAMGDYQKALDHFNQIDRIVQETCYTKDCYIYNNELGKVYSALGDYQKAIEVLNKGLSFNRTRRLLPREDEALAHLSEVYEKIGDRQKTLDFYNQRLSLWQKANNARNEAEVLFQLARFHWRQENINDALAQMKSAIKIIELLRTRSISEKLRTSYFASVQRYYEFYIDLLMQMHKQQPQKGYDGDALQANESSRARTLLELLHQAGTDIRSGVDPVLREKEQKVQQQINAISKRQIELLNDQHTPEQAVAIQQQLNDLLQQYEQVQVQIRATSPRYATLTQPQPLTLKEIQQQVLDDNTLLLEYSLGEERSYLWAVTKSGITSYELPKRADIEAVAKQFRDVINDPLISQDETQVAKTSAQLSQVILAPVANQLSEKRLLIVGDGILQYIPFAALSLPVTNGNTTEYKPLIVNHEIVYLPSASTLAISRRELTGRAPALKTMAMLADPVFAANDERLKTAQAQASTAGEQISTLQLQRAADESGVNLKRLPFTRQEAEAIMKLIPATEREQSFDFDASRTAATSSQLNQYRIVHFATHGILNPTNPELSGIVMSLVDKDGNIQNGFLRLNDIFNLKLSADMVVLSACKTASGQNIRGEGIVGLTRGFIYAGAARVVASLWSVNDPATAELMTKFYQRYLKEGLPAAAALRAAQIEMLKQEQWRSPYYWAAFTLQGEWR